MTEPAPLPDEVQRRFTQGAFLLIDKPRGPTSHQVTAWVRDLLGLDKTGHAGTLDPNVSGLLWVGVGPALKLIPLVLEFPKRYVGVIVLHGAVRPAELDRAILEFVGPVYQTPPVRSAVRRERRIRTIHRLTRLESDGLRVVVDVTADSGTYVRTLAVDLGEALGVGAHLEELRRIGTGPFKEAASASMTELADDVAGAREGRPEALLARLRPMSEVWGQFPILKLKESAAAAIAHGANLANGGIAGLVGSFRAGRYVVLTTDAGELLGFGTSRVASDELSRHREGWVVEVERVLADSQAFPLRWRKGRPVVKPVAKPAPG